MIGLIARALLGGLAGLIVLPIAVFFLVLVTGYLFDSRCGTPGDSGGCEMGAATLAFVSAIPGFVIGFAVLLFRGLRARRG